MDKLQAMATYITVVETQGFSAAARKLQVSTSVISRLVNELEEHLGVRLLNRTTRIVRTTEAGATFFEECRRVLATIEAAELAAAGAHNTPRGQLTITAPIVLGNTHVTPLVQEFLARYPDVNVSCWFLDRPVNLVDEGVDVAVRIGELPSSSLQAIAVGKVRSLLCASPAYLQARGEPKDLEDLASHVTIQATPATPFPEWRFRSENKPIVVPIQPRLITTTNDSAMSAAVAGLGIVCLLSCQVASALAHGKLRVVLPKHELATVPIHVVHREGRHVNQKVRVFVDLAVEILRADKTLWFT
ncbi:Transcriptional regulator (plasmid) [Burkholderia sp. YI23]|uniref:LysR family transcriptional regulator n=1 Tax=unclassified Caballeronia TaxID=2646786 RepID=UPI0002388819|nr:MULTISPECIES: LysR family transcriptional regulator [unclassified Caballeronia]AET95003.1 Transcriptional regulator [Burkholderia sp. YI23]MCE4546010.1 LysR family transcriptional regulator [Caballeronia sp. PC1]MCE4571868.1 LysR family transcriptional regulator [Caballeronia sp. CLC5]